MFPLPISPLLSLGVVGRMEWGVEDSKLAEICFWRKGSVIYHRFPMRLVSPTSSNPLIPGSKCHLRGPVTSFFPKKCKRQALGLQNKCWGQGTAGSTHIPPLWGVGWGQITYKPSHNFLTALIQPDRQPSIMVESLDLKARLPGFESWFHHLLVV